MSDQFRISRRHLLAAIGATGLAVSLAACKSAASTATTVGGGSTTAAGGGVLKIAQSADIQPATLFGQNNPNFSVARTVFNTLTEYDHRTLQPKPSLATSWTTSPDGLTTTLQLRKGVTFHSGRPFTADDVVFAITNLQQDAVASQLKHVALAVTSATAEDDHTVTLKLAHPVSNLFDLFEILLIVDKDTVADLAKGTMVGTGPFKVDRYTPGTGLTLSRYEKYWKSGSPALDGVEISVISQSQSAISSLRSGQTHLILDLPPADAIGLKGSSGFQVVASDAHDSAFYVGANTTVKPLHDKRVRQAVAWAVDRDRILTQVLGGIGTTTSLPWSPSSPAYDAVKGATYKQDLAKARQLLAEAGASGASLKVLYNAALGANEKIAEVVVYNLGQVGLKATAVPLQGPDFGAKMTAGTLPGLFVNNHGFGQLHPATLVKGAWPFAAAGNAANYTDPAYQALADQLWQTTDEATAKKAADAINDLLIEQQFIIDLVSSSHTYTVTDKLSGLAYNMYDYIDLDTARIGA